MIYKRYLASEILRSAAGVFFLVVVIFACDCAVKYLSESVAGFLPPAKVGYLILLRVAIGLEVILPVTFFLAVIIALGRLYKDSEMTAFGACGVGMANILKTIIALALPVAILSAVVSLSIRPGAWTEIYRVMDEAQDQFDISRLFPGSFLKIRAGKVVFFADEVDKAGSSAQNVFVRIAEGEKRSVIRAQEMAQEKPTSEALLNLTFRSGTIYEPPAKGEPGKVTRFQQVQYSVPGEPPGNSNYRRKATPTNRLIGSERPHDIAELQWRLSAPLSTLLLALLAVPLSKSSPRKGKFARIGLAIIIFAVYFQVFTIARTWVDRTYVPSLPGIWWVPALLFLLALVLVWRTDELFCRQPK
ncbi:MAG: LPS export ABC transporter permease LptF [Desulfobacterales bacterium]|nr:LPS export ABC transporter permease LptF [Desulfobacterales bacterium]